MNTNQITGAAPDLGVGEFAVVALGMNGSMWNTGRTYSTGRVAFGVATREANAQDCNAYVVKRHAAGITVYLSPSTVLGTVTA